MAFKFLRSNVVFAFPLESPDPKINYIKMKMNTEDLLTSTLLELSKRMSAKFSFFCCLFFCFNPEVLVRKLQYQTGYKNVLNLLH